MSEDNLLNNPALKNIDPAKLQLLLSLTDQAKGKSQSELLPFLLAASSSSGSPSFSSDEISTIIEVMKMGKSPQEIQRIDRLMALVKQFRH